MSPTTLPNTALLSLRIVVGVTFLLHGLDKLGDVSGTEQFFASLGIPAPGLMAPFVAATETVGGLLLIVGLATRLAAAALAANMLVALATAHDQLEFFVADGGVELEVLLAGASLALVLAGAGRFSLDDVIGVPQRIASLATSARRASRPRSSPSATRSSTARSPR